MHELSALANLMRVPAASLDEEAFHRWLCDFDELYTMDASAAERLSESFDSFSPGKGPARLASGSALTPWKKCIPSPKTPLKKC